MFANRHFDLVRELFAEQFEAEAGGFIYRKSSKGAAIRVSAGERDAFVATFITKLRYAVLGTVVGILLFIGFLVLVVPEGDSSVYQTAIYAGVTGIMALFLAAYYRAWNEPMRHLERRPIAGEALTREEARRMALAKISYGHLAIVALGGFAVLWNASAKHDVLHGWGVLWPVFAGFLVILAGVQAFRKWLSERAF